MAEEFKTISTQEELDAVIKDRLSRERAKYADYDDLKARVQKLTEENTSYAEKIKAGNTGLQTQLDEALKKVKTYERDSLKMNVAIEKGLPLELRERLTGETKEEIEADAEKLLKVFSDQNRKHIPGFSANERGGEGDEKTAAYKELLEGLKISKE